jgi:deoxycytidylate deaminase
MIEIANIFDEESLREHMRYVYFAAANSDERPMKYSLTEHAERDVIYKAARWHHRTKGSTLVANWVACPDCARAIVLAGISTVVCHQQCMDRTPDRWREMVDLGLFILKQGGVEVRQWSGTVGRVDNLNNGEIWQP